MSSKSKEEVFNKSKVYKALEKTYTQSMYDLLNAYLDSGRVLDYLKPNTASNETAYDLFAEYLGYRDRGRVIKQLRKTYKDYSNDKFEQYLRERLSILRLLYLGFSIRPSYLDINDIVLGERFLKKDSDSIVEYYRFRDTTVKRGKDKSSAEEYISAIKRYINIAPKTIDIYEYLGKAGDGLPDQTMEEYSKYHESVYKHIETSIQERKIQYRRFIGLPFDHEKPFSGEYSSLATFRIGEFVSCCSEQLFEHIIRCLADGANQLLRPKFIIVPKAFRPSQYGILGDYLISEYFIFNDEGQLEPNIILIEHKNLIKMGEDYFREMNLYDEDFAHYRTREEAKEIKAIKIPIVVLKDINTIEKAIDERKAQMRDKKNSAMQSNYTDQIKILEDRKKICKDIKHSMNTLTK